VKIEALLEAVKIGDLEIISKILTKNRNLINESSVQKHYKDCSTPLLMAFKEGHALVVHNLIDQGASFIPLPKNEHRAYNGKSVLHLAIEKNWRWLVEMLIGKGMDIRIGEGEKNYQPIHYAAYWNRLEIIKILLDQDSELINATNTIGMTPLMCAIHRGNVAVVRHLLERKPDLTMLSGGMTALDLAENKLQEKKEEESYKEIVTLLKDASAKTTCKMNAPGNEDLSMQQRSYNQIKEAIEKNNLSVVKSSIETNSDVINFQPEVTKDGVVKNDFSILHLAIQHKRKDIVEWLISHGASIHAVAHGTIPIIHHATCDLEIFKIIVAQVNEGTERQVLLNTLNAGCMTPLMSAVLNNNEAVVEYLIQQKVDLNCYSNDHYTALHYALWTKRSSESVALKLIEAGADITLRGKNGVYAIHCAAMTVVRDEEEVQECYLEAFKKLVEKNPRQLHWKDNDGNTPLAWAISNKNTKVVAYIYETLYAEQEKYRPWKMAFFVGLSVVTGGLFALAAVYFDLWQRDLERVKVPSDVNNSIKALRKTLHNPTFVKTKNPNKPKKVIVPNEISDELTIYMGKAQATRYAFFRKAVREERKNQLSLAEEYYLSRLRKKSIA